MTKAVINAIIKENNQNRDIHWKVLENKKDKIVITNDYDECVQFTIQKVQDCVFSTDEESAIECYDEHMKHCFAYLIKGTQYWADYKDETVGLTIAIKKVVRHFYYYY